MTLKSQVKSLYDKYEVDMEMWDYRIEPYLSYAGGEVIDNMMCWWKILTMITLIDKNLSIQFHVSVNTLPPKYAPKQEEAKTDG